MTTTEQGGTPELRRHVVIDEEYLDGISGFEVRVPTEYDREVIALPAALVEAVWAAEHALDVAKDAVREARRTAPTRNNPKYQEIDDDAD